MTTTDEDLPIRIERGAPLVATPSRIAGFVSGAAALVVGGAYGYLAFVKPKDTTLETLLPWILFGAASLGLIVFVLLRAEESRLTRELRTARTGTERIRGLILERRQKAPFFLRYLSTTLGTAAVMVADGDRGGARVTLEQGSPLVRGGRLAAVREVVRADMERAAATPSALERAIAGLRAAPRIGNTEADRYKTHVLVKAVLQKGDAEAARALEREIAGAKDEEERLYAVWLRAWFDLDEDSEADEPLPPYSEAELRLAALLARTHGADDLVKKLEARIAAIAAGTSGG